MTASLEQDVLDLSRQSWSWMSNRDVAALAPLVDDDAVFVHMGATLSKTDELTAIDSGQIHYRDIDIRDHTVRIIDQTAIVLTTLQLGAVVGGTEVSNPFVVAEVYIRRGETDAQPGSWTLGSMSFTRLLNALPTPTT
jgi:hypothetical protein